MARSVHRVIPIFACVLLGVGSMTCAADELDGLWRGAWGGGEKEGGVVIQPVIAEMLIRGDRVEVHGFPALGNAVGKIRLDASARRLYVAAAESVVYEFDLQGDKLTLAGSDRREIVLTRVPTLPDPVANVQLEIVAAQGLNEAGDLLVTEFTALQAASTGRLYYVPHDRVLKTARATVLLVQEEGVKTITVAEARRRVRPSTPVAVAFRPDDRSEPQQIYHLWKNLGAPPPDGAAIAQTFARILRPGTLIFVLSARENVVLP